MVLKRPTFSLVEVQENIRDLSFESEAVTLSGIGLDVLQANGEEFHVSDQAFRDLVKLSGHKTLDKVPRELAFPVLSHAMNGKPIQIANRGGNRHGVERCYDPSVKMLNHERLLASMTEGAGREFETFRNVMYSPTSFNICGVLPIEEEVEPGDNVWLGVGMQWRTNGHTEISVAPFIERQFCSNGATSTRWLKFSKRKKEFDPYEVVMRAASEAVESFDSVIDFLRESAQTFVNFDRQEDAIKRLMGGCGIPGQFHKQVLEHWRLQPQTDRSLWDLLNLVTYVGQHEIHDPEVQWNVMRVGGHALHSRSVCNECRRLN